MKRTISTMVGKGSVNHNSRQFHAKNTDPERSNLNIEYCNERIQGGYHELFDEALQRYNARQKRPDRVIKNYYEKICTGKQEKPFHEIILQIGNREDMNAQSENGQFAAKVLDEYMRGFQKRNPQLRVFSAHLHMDEATPHLHIDFVPFITGSKWGLDTRVSLKKALEDQGVAGGSRSDTEWNQWVTSEKNVLASVMERYGIQWEKKGTHEKHLSVLDFQKQGCTKEVTELESQKADIQERVDDLTDAYFRKTDEIAQIEDAPKSLKEKTLEIEAVEGIEAKPVPLSGKVMISKQDYDTLTTAAQKYVIQEKKEGKIQRMLDAANEKIQELLHTISELKQTMFGLNNRVSALENELAQERSFEKKFAVHQIEQENMRLKQENTWFRDILKQHSLLQKRKERDVRIGRHHFSLNNELSIKIVI